MANVQIIIEPVEPDHLLDHIRDSVLVHDEVIRDIREARGALGEPAGREHAPDDLEGLVITPPDVSVRAMAKGRQDATFTLTVYDPVSNTAREVTGRVAAPDTLAVHRTMFRPNPSDRELTQATDRLRQDPGFERYSGREAVVIYQPMPPLADRHLDDGTSIRQISLGIFDPEGSPTHQFVAVPLDDGPIQWDHPDLPGPSDRDCEEHLPVEIASLPVDDGPDRVHVRVISGTEELWRFDCVRPRASTPAAKKGSGVELQRVHYKGRLVLWQAHVPILNVHYDDGVTYRDWQNGETRFEAVGVDPVGPGWRVCTSPPATILEATSDAGNFQGVAFWYEAGEVRIVSELQASWYRYVSDWRLRDDGSIGPRFGFAGTRNPRTCMVHHHNAYWRLDFDIDGAGNDCFEVRTPRILGRARSWRPLPREAVVKRSVFRTYRVLDKSTQRGYVICPSPLDGKADPYGVADLWFLRYHGNEIEDGVYVVGGTTQDTAARISNWVNGEPIDGTDVVLWYAGHFDHDENAPGPHQGHIIGPDFRPFGW